MHLVVCVCVLLWQVTRRHKSIRTGFCCITNWTQQCFQVSKKHSGCGWNHENYGILWPLCFLLPVVLCCRSAATFFAFEERPPLLPSLGRSTSSFSWSLYLLLFLLFLLLVSASSSSSSLCQAVVWRWRTSWKTMRCSPPSSWGTYLSPTLWSSIWSTPRSDLSRWPYLALPLSSSSSHSSSRSLLPHTPPPSQHHPTMLWRYRTIRNSTCWDHELDRFDPFLIYIFQLRLEFWEEWSCC